ncbi:MAG: hypothetical protein MZV70_74900 [Desulfobacterales bacterium]|nr:hypothetical protein [Desulfobacterales bacterium]
MARRIALDARDTQNTGASQKTLICLSAIVFIFPSSLLTLFATVFACIGGYHY